MTTVHGTCLVVARAGLLLRGPSGSGKSDLALRMIHDDSGRLVADDRVAIELGPDGRLWASAPVMLAGRIEVRGIGILPVGHQARSALHGVVDLVGRSEVERLPEDETVMILEHPLPRFALHAFDASAPARLALIARCCREREARP